MTTKHKTERPDVEKGCPPKLKRCIQHLKDKGHDESSAYAICINSTGLKPGKKKKKRKKEKTMKAAIAFVVPVPSKLQKAEGSRGGTVIGRTKSGKAIYESSHTTYKHSTHAKWGIGATTQGWSLQDHAEARKLHANNAALQDKAAGKVHLKAARVHEKAAIRMRKTIMRTK